MQRRGLFVLAGLLVLAVGCQWGQKSITGIVTAPEAGAPALAPEVTFQTSGDGKTWKLSQLYGDVTIVAFATLEGESCARASAPVLTAAQKLKGHGIPIVEVTYPTGGCKEPSCSVAYHDGSHLFTCLVDPEGRARKSFGVGGQDLVFLLSGPEGKIEKVASPDNLGGLIEMAKEIDHKRDFRYTEFIY